MAYEPWNILPETLSRIGKKLDQIYAEEPREDDGRFADLLRRLEATEQGQRAPSPGDMVSMQSVAASLEA